MLPSSHESTGDTRIAPGTVVVTFATNASAKEVWQALTEPVTVARWFGTLTPALHSGKRAHLDFGDGDFFVLEDIRLDPPNLVQYTWQFLGIGPRDTITWRIVPKDKGCLVTVTDSEPERSRESALLLKEGWLDFTHRLERFLTTGESTRYDWRREFDGSIELPCKRETAWEVLFMPPMQTRWLPFGGSTLEAGAYIMMTDGVDPSVLQLINVAWEPPNCVRFQVAHTSWLHPTNCQLELSPRRGGTMLTISHVGWEAISPRSEDQRQQRKRFSVLWINALRRAQQLIEEA